MHTVWFRPKGFKPDTEAYLFIGGIPTEGLAQRIADNLVAEGFVAEAWVDER
jgi:hypothetical protein